jgi:hypothetical protein
MIDFYTEAMKYARFGWAVFPCAPGDKVPAIKGGHGVKDATCDEAIIRLWARSYPHANIGLACGAPSGNLIVIDIDPRHGGEGSLARLALNGRAFPNGPCAKTGNGGKHLFFRHGSGKLSNSAGKLGQGLDIRVTGGYVVAPPSFTNPSKSGPGGQYSWIVSPWDAIVPRLPIWVSALLTPPPPKPYVPPKTFAEGAERLDHLANYVQKIPEGNRNAAVFWAACRAAEMANDGKVSPQVIRERLRVAGQIAGLSASEVEKAIDSALKRSGQA